MAKRKNITRAEIEFYSGILAALAVVVLFDYETLFREIVRTVDEEKLVRIARANDDMETSGLSKYGYGLERANG